MLELSLLRAHSHGGLAGEGEEACSSEHEASPSRSPVWKGGALVLLAAAAVAGYILIHWTVLVASVSGLLNAIG